MKYLFFNLVFISLPFFVDAQWTTSGNDLSTTYNNIILNSNKQSTATLWLGPMGTGPSTIGHYYIKAYDYWGPYLHFQATGDNGNEKMNVTVDGKVGIGTTSPSNKLHVAHTDRMAILLGGPSTSSGAIADLTFKPTDGLPVGGANYWNWSFRTDSWSSAPGDLVLYSNNGTYTSPIIAQADGDLLLTTGNGSARNGNVGIGIVDPIHKLHVNGNSFINGTQYFKTVAYNGVTSQTHLSFPVHSDGFSIMTQQVLSDRMEVLFRMRDNTTGDALKIWFDDYRGESYDRNPFIVYGDRVLLASDGGNVGIGTTTPTEKLVVDGKILAEEIKVQNVPASDYVFEPDYKLKPIEELEAYIKENKHLPDIPSSEEFKENGVGLGEMDDMLLRKVEELTLYVIEQNKKLKAEGRNNENLMEVVMELKRENEEMKAKDKAKDEEFEELKAMVKELMNEK